MTKYLVVDEDKPIGDVPQNKVIIFLENMAADGWELVSAVAYQKKGGIYTRYFFRRLAALALTPDEEEATA